MNVVSGSRTRDIKSHITYHAITVKWILHMMEGREIEFEFAAFSIIQDLSLV